MADASPDIERVRTVPTSTYRLQLHAGFDFEAAATVVPYLAQLGVSHLYLSPILQAAPGSMHGYDVVDHSRVSVDLGGEAALLSLADVAHQHGLGIVVDVVPNHMAIPTPASLNHALWETLRLGRDSTTSAWFDVDWDLCDGRIGLPLLGQPLAQAVAAGELSLDDNGAAPVVRYFEQQFPVTPGTEHGSLEEVLDHQHYVLAGWREKDAVLGYRRFFDVDTLIAIRVEIPEVFDATHAVLIDLRRRGVIDGFRIDHPDGLADPQGYLDRLRSATSGAWVVVEKILEGDETLPSRWATDGTTGYDAVRAIQTSLAPGSRSELQALWSDVEGAEASLHTTELAAKHFALQALLRPELLRLVRRAKAAADEAGYQIPAPDLEAALAAMLVNVDVYRAYVRLDEEPNDAAVSRLRAMHDAALRDDPALVEPLAVIVKLLVDSSTSSEAGRDLVVRFQQVCGPVMAKGIEDTTFYRWHQFIALNEVGGDPASQDGAGVEALHDWAAEQSMHHPDGMTTLSTHDTKRSEDVRARLLASGEDIGGWTGMWRQVRALAAKHNVDQPTAYLLMQTLLGTWPIAGDRLRGYLEKATREAKQLTSWNEPDQAYEARVAALADECLSPGAVADTIQGWLGAHGEAIRATTLTSKLLQLTAPGVPDTYQGAETVVLSLVDPDNRRAVDFTDRRSRLSRLHEGGDRRDLDDEKLWVTTRALRLRREHSELFGARSTHRPLATTCPHLVGFVRGERVIVVGTRWPGQLERDGWSGATVALPDGMWVDILTGRHASGSREVECAELLADLPVALLLRENE